MRKCSHRGTFRLIFMRIAIFLTSLLFAVSSISARDTTITFRHISYSDVFALAKEERKPVFLYFHFDGCGACVEMERTAFRDKDVADFYNENFICLAVNTREGDGIEINKIYRVKLHPTFLYLDEDGRVLNKIVGVYNTEEFLLQGKNALNETATLSAFKKQYDEGNREGGFLLDYCYKLRNAEELNSLVISEYLNTQSLADLGDGRNIKFIYEFAVHHFEVTMPFGSRAFQFLRTNKDKFASFFEPEQVDTRIVWIVINSVYQAIENQDRASFDRAMMVLSDFDNGSVYSFKEMDGRTTGRIAGKSLVLTSEMAYFEKSGDNEMYQKSLMRYIEKIWDDYSALNTMAWNYYENSDDKECLMQAVSWVVRSIELNSTYPNNDTYAALLYKLGEYDAALRQAETAISIAKRDDRDYRETTGLIEKIKAVKK